MTAALVLLKHFEISKANNSNNNRHDNGRNRNTVNNANEANVGVTRVKANQDQCFICGKLNHHAKACCSVMPEIRERHLTEGA